MAEKSQTQQPPAEEQKQQQKLNRLEEALRSQASQGAQQQTPVKKEAQDEQDPASQTNPAEAKPDGEEEQPAKKKKKKKNKKKKKKNQDIAIDTGEQMSLQATAFVPSTTSTLPAQFQGAQVVAPAMPMPITAADAKPALTSAQTDGSAATVSNPFEKMTISSKNFVPINIQASGQSIQGESAVGDAMNQGLNNRGHANSVDPSDFGGYMNPYSATIDIEKEKRKQQELEEQEQKSKTYSIDFMMSFKNQCRTRPNNMALLVLPHKKRQVKLNQGSLFPVEKDQQNKFTNQVGKLRQLLNKISKENYDKVSHQLINDFDYNPSLLQELMKIIFMKSTTETAYLDIYIKLCISFFKKFDDPEHTEMNFKKLLLTRCQKQFYKMLQREQMHRRERRASMEEALIKDDLQQDFNKQMLFVFDKDELKMRQQDQMHGNMKLIVELFKLDMVSGNIVKTCLDELFQELSARNIEVLCNMVDTLTTFQVIQSRKSRQEKSDPSTKPQEQSPVVQNEKPANHGRKQYQVKGTEAKKQYKPKTSIVSLDYLENCLQVMIKERTNTQIESRVRFKIQDLIDKFDKDWKHEIFFARRNESDSDSFQKKYVPKGSKLAQEVQTMVKSQGKNGRSRKNSKVDQPNKKQGASSNQAQNSKGQGASDANKGKGMYQLLQSLAADDNIDGRQEESLSEDEDASKLVDRRTSINIDNVIGLDFEHYNKMKPSQQIKLKIKNMVEEFVQAGDLEAATLDFADICQQTETQPFMVAGYILNNGFSQDANNWNRICSLIVDHLNQQENRISTLDLVESLNVAMANFVDTIIDYPNSKIYVQQLVERMQQIEALSAKQAANYLQHIGDIEKQAFDLGNDD